jgi:predicted nucleic acid-binding Zn ribbon protein
LTAAGFQLKGSGWYATDFKGSSAAESSAPSTETAPPPCANGPCPACG